MNQVAEYYESTLNKLWEHLTVGQVHLGYWDEGEELVDFRQATRRMTELMIEQTTINTGERFVDLGCGMGWPAVELIKARGCQVEGMTLSPWQKQRADALAQAEGLSQQAHFYVMDARHLDFPSASFDGGWFFESIFHMGHADALREAARVLKPGAGLVLTDCVDAGRLTEEEKAFARQVANAAYIPASAYPALLDEWGFELLELRDITPRVMGPFEERFREAIEKHWDELVEVAQEDKASLQAFSGLSQALVKSVDYVLVRARRRS